MTWQVSHVHMYVRTYLTVGKFVYASIELVENLCAWMLKPTMKETDAV